MYISFKEKMGINESHKTDNEYIKQLKKDNIKNVVIKKKRI